MSDSHRENAFDETPRSPFLWCLHCERTYDRGQWRNEAEYQMCPYADCDGDAVIDAWDWASVRDHNPQYPEMPEPGRVYPLYPETCARHIRKCAGPRTRSGPLTVRIAPRCHTTE